jgi:hypothetical protein
VLRKKIKPDAAGQGVIVDPDGESKPVRLAPRVLILGKFPDRAPYLLKEHPNEKK